MQLSQWDNFVTKEEIVKKVIQEKNLDSRKKNHAYYKASPLVYNQCQKVTLN